MNTIIRLKSWGVMSLVLLSTSCALFGGNSGPTKAERMESLSRIKTQLAIEYMGAQDYRAAVAAIDEAIEADRRFDYAWMIKGLIYQTLKVNDKADQAYRQALSISPNSAEINNNYGWFVCDGMQQPAQSLQYFDRALADPTYPTPQTAQMNKGICEARSGHFASAAANLARTRALAPWFAPAIKEMARLKLMEGQTPQATDLFNEYQSKVEILSPDDLLLGLKISRARGDTQAAYEYEAQLRTRYPSSDEARQLGTGGY
ncbi:MAG: type IV pilus biogenesis/stability protein PilW [Neisseria sp.]|nr:type IV pilus biogenesis/stability protein PilW [Neisseria sp.]